MSGNARNRKCFPNATRTAATNETNQEQKEKSKMNGIKGIKPKGKNIENGDQSGERERCGEI